MTFRMWEWRQMNRPGRSRRTSFPARRRQFDTVAAAAEECHAPVATGVIKTLDFRTVAEFGRKAG
jgi:hypothetical protein